MKARALIFLIAFSVGTSAEESRLVTWRSHLRTEDTVVNEKLKEFTLEKLKSIGAKQAGNAPLGAVVMGGYYFHFYIARKDREELLKTLGAQISLKEEIQTHARKVPDGQERVVIWLGLGKSEMVASAPTTASNPKGTAEPKAKRAPASDAKKQDHKNTANPYTKKNPERVTEKKKPEAKAAEKQEAKAEKLTFWMHAKNKWHELKGWLFERKTLVEKSSGTLPTEETIKKLKDKSEEAKQAVPDALKNKTPPKEAVQNKASNKDSNQAAVPTLEKQNRVAQKDKTRIVYWKSRQAISSSRKKAVSEILHSLSAKKVGPVALGSVYNGGYYFSFEIDADRVEKLREKLVGQEFTWDQKFIKGEDKYFDSNERLILWFAVGPDEKPEDNNKKDTPVLRQPASIESSALEADVLRWHAKVPEAYKTKIVDITRAAFKKTGAKVDDKKKKSTIYGGGYYFEFEIENESREKLKEALLDSGILVQQQNDNAPPSEGVQKVLLWIQTP